MERFTYGSLEHMAYLEENAHERGESEKDVYCS